MIRTSKLKSNPSNPRTISKEQLQKLKRSIESFPEMMEKRPMVCVTDTDGKIFPLGGNMRLKAIKSLGIKEIPDNWVMLADDWTEEQRREFIIKDNTSLGQWDFEDLNLNWNVDELEEWGLDMPNFEIEPEKEQKDLSDQLKETFEVIISAIDEKQQEQIYNKLIGEGYQCRVLTL